MVSHIAEGRGSKEIARLLGLSPLTVGKHRRDAYRRLGVRSVPELCRALRSIQSPAGGLP